MAMLGAPRLLVLLAIAGVAVVASCATFGGEDPLPDGGVDEASTSDAGPDDSGRDASDGSAPDGSGLPALAAPCPPASGGAGLPGQWQQRVLYTPSVRMYPFDMATDATHVTWLAHVGTNYGGPDTEAYNGSGMAVLLRAPKDGNGPAVTLARDQPSARALVLDGDYAYFTTDSSGSKRLVRQRRDADCSVDCAEPTPVMTFPPGVKIDKLVRPEPGLLFAIGEAGQVFRVKLGDVSPTRVSTSGTYPSLTATTTDVYASAGLSPDVVKVPVSGGAPVEPYLSFPPADGGPPGVVPIATDCTALWMVREFAQPQIYRHDLASAGSLTPVGGTLDVNAFDLAVDTRFLYVASPNAGGIALVEKSSGNRIGIYNGNVHRVAVDDDGVYFGEHGPQATTPKPGTMIMLVKK
jgi:hypothetical protein